MRRWIIICFPLIVLFILSGYGFISAKKEVPQALRIKEPTEVLFPMEETSFTSFTITPPFLGSKFNGFKEALAFKESQGNYFAINTFGYLGKYQFGINTLELMGVTNGNTFLRNPVLQEKVFHLNVSRNKWILRRELKRFAGVRIKGIEITESGILAAAHLAGAGNVKTYLRSYGKLDVFDGFGTSIEVYMKKFSGYDTSMISPVRNPRI